MFCQSCHFLMSSYTGWCWITLVQAGSGAGWEIRVKGSLGWSYISSFCSSPHLLALCRYTGGNWITLVQAGGSARWEIRVKGDLSPRADNGRINSSPTTAVAPVLTLRHGVTHTITIPGKVSSSYISICLVHNCHSYIPMWSSNGLLRPSIDPSFPPNVKLVLARYTS